MTRAQGKHREFSLNQSVATLNWDSLSMEEIALAFCVSCSLIENTELSHPQHYVGLSVWDLEDVN